MDYHLRCKKIASYTIALILISTLSAFALNQAPDSRPIKKNKKILHEKFGTPTQISGRFIATNSDKQITALDFFNEKKGTYKLNNPSQELQLLKENVDDLGLTHIKYNQVYKGLPVWGCQTIVHFENDGSIYLVGGQTAPTPEVSTTPYLNASDASSRAFSHLKNKIQGMEMDVETELLIYPVKTESYLCWKVIVKSNEGKPYSWLLFVDAHSGEIRHLLNNVCSADGPVESWGNDVFDTVRTVPSYIVDGTNRMINTTNSMYTAPIENMQGVIAIYMEGMSGIARDIIDDSAFIELPHYAAAVSGQFLMQQAYDYYNNTFGHNSWDNNGGSIHMHVNQTDVLNNAYYLGDGVLSFGAGDTVNYLPWSASLDMITHELGHGVTHTLVGLIYEFQSGALSESYSDFFGAMADPDDWYIAEDIKVSGMGFLRSLENPHEGSVPDYFPFGYQPSHMSEYVDTVATWDNGAVHFNSGIPNHVGYLVAEAVGRSAAEQIWYRTLTTYLTSGSGFSFWGEMTAQAAIDLYGVESAEVSAILDALNAVGIVNTFAKPDNISMTIPFGTFDDADFYVYGGMSDTIDVLSATSVLGNVEITASFPSTLYGYDSLAINVLFDATIYDNCQLGYVYDTVIVTTTSVSVPTISIPVKALVSGEYYNENFPSHGIGRDYCSVDLFYEMLIKQTTGIEDFFRENDDGLFQASLMIGLINDNDTTVYRDLFTEQSLLPNGPFGWSGRYYGPTIYDSVSFLSDGGSIFGQVKYYTDKDLAHCGELVAEYTLYNICDTTLSIVTAVCADFDVTESGENYAGIIVDDNIAYVRNSDNSRAVGVAAYRSTARNLRALNNPNDIWPTSNLPTGLAYSEMMETTNTTGDTLDDWSVIMTFDTTTLAPGDTVIYRAAFLHSNVSAAHLSTMLDHIGLITDSAQLTLDTNYITLRETLNNPSPQDTTIAITYEVDYVGGNSVEWSASHNSSWLSLDAYSGMTNDTLILSFDLTGLEPGFYYDTITVTSDSAINGPQQTIIEMQANPGTGVINMPTANLPTIQRAIDLALDGDSILVGAGEYNERILIYGKAVKIIGQGPALTLLKPNERFQVVVFSRCGSNVSEISGFTISNGWQRDIIYNFLSSVKISNNIFHTNDGSNKYGVIQSEFSNMIIENNIFYDNEGVYTIKYNNEATITNNTFINNEAGILGGSSIGIVKNNIIMNTTNTAISGTFAELDCNNVWNNTVDYNGTTPGPNDISVNPLFCDAPAEILTLVDTSACLPSNNSCGVLMGALGVGCTELCAHRADVDHSGGESPVDISDLVFMVAFMFQAGEEPQVIYEADVDASGAVDISDLVYLVAYMFSGGNPPVPCN